MLQLGMNITLGTADTLRKIQVSDLHRFVRDGAFDLQARTEQLRKVQAIDHRKYQEIKVFLPYVTCGIFHPPMRRTENFAFIDSFFLDLDHLSSKELTPEWIKNKLSGDDRVEFMFTSPGNDGIKILFPLSQRITDPVKYSLFYKVFATQFTREYGIEQIIDTRTCDVTRACFLAHDPDVIFHDYALPVNPDSVIDFESAEQVDQARQIPFSETPAPEAPLTIAEEATAGLTRDKMNEIRKKLNPNAVIRKEKQIFVPEKLNLLVQVITERSKEVGLEILGVKDINYGKQISFGLDLLKGELNVFYGKKGYTIVKSSKSGCSEELNELAYQLVAGILY